MPPLTYAERFPPLPLEIDDAYIFKSHVTPQPAGIVSELRGFNLNVAVFRSYSSLTSLEMAFGRDELYDWDRQRRMIVRTLRDVKSATDRAPPELQLNPSADGVWPWPEKLSISGSRTSWADAVGLNDTQNSHMPPPSKRSVQYEIQKANIYASGREVLEPVRIARPELLTPRSDNIANDWMFRSWRRRKDSGADTKRRDGCRRTDHGY
jgi:hypothetical protein